MVKVDEKTHFVFDDKELAKLTEGDEEAQFVEIFEAEDIQDIQKRLSKYELTAQEFLKPQIADSKLSKVGKNGKKKAKKNDAAELKPLYVIENERDKHEFFCLKEVLVFVREQANKGMHIQRYKGLGEMNPQQLWETTMDPAKRTLLKVALEDAVEVDKTFNMLMGDEVGPRREFIEAFAHEVKNLDI